MAKHLVLLCSKFHSELQALDRRELPPEEVELRTFSGNCERVSPLLDLLPEDVDPSGYETIDVVSGPCVSRLPETSDIEYGHHGTDLCFDVLVNPTTTRWYASRGYYMATPGWIRNWRSEIEPWGFDRETIREFFAPLEGGVLMLDTGVDDEASAHLAEFAEHVGRPSSTLPVGTDYLELFLAGIFLGRKLASRERAHSTERLRDQRVLSNYAMGLDFLRQLSATLSEREVVDFLIETFTMLFGPRKIRYLEAGSVPPGEVDPEYGEDGFRLPVRSGDEFFGVIRVEGLAFPEYRDRYLSVALGLLDVAGLAIANARRYETIRGLADTDGLTGVPNRRSFDEFLSKAWTRHAVDGKQMAILLVDVDYFKAYNDTYGHVMGDHCLRTIAEAIGRDCLRPSDLLARYGGEEFGVILVEADEEAAFEVAERIRRRIEDLEMEHEASDVSEAITVSIGLAAQVPGESRDPVDLVRRADEALYEAKEAGRNRTWRAR